MIINLKLGKKKKGSFLVGQKKQCSKMLVLLMISVMMNEETLRFYIKQLKQNHTFIQIFGFNIYVIRQL